jgi:LPXTG-site transpeptidase (sortase) family protein
MPANKTYLLIGLAALGLITYGVVKFSLVLAHTQGQAAPPDIRQVVTSDTTRPVEKKPAADNFVVPADQPKIITLPTLSVSGPIQKVGLNTQNAISVPTNVHFVGWYTGSVKPGENGLSVIDGHISGVYGPGIFKRLGSLQRGDTFHITYGDGNQRGFEVVDHRVLPAKEAAAYLLTQRATIRKQLNLITCDGVYDKHTKLYDKRLVVVTQAIN